MAVALEKFVQQLEDSGILAGDTLKDFLPPKSEPKDAEELARELVRQKKLTKFQAEEVSKGKGKSLVLGNYVLMEKIGAGGMGQVFKARHRRMDRLVAVKLLPAAMTRDSAAIARFEREVKAAAKLRHPNIIAADDADQANGIHFLVMELVDGSDLSALVKKDGPFPVDKAVNCVLQAAKGLEAAHAEGIVHRDIKPANLLLDKKGTVKILDMGLARIHGEAGTQAELTATGAVMGTVDYMAPEQALSTKTADARADIYSLGCSLYYLLTARATYDGETLMAKLIAHREQPIPSLGSVRAETPDQLEAVFKRMVAKKIEDRYQTMTEVIAALEDCARGLSNTMHLPSLETGQTIPLRDKFVSSDTVTLPPVTRGVEVNSKGSSASKSVESSTEANFTDVLDNLSVPAKSVRTKKLPKVKRGKNSLLNDQKKLLLIGGAVLGVMILLAGVVINMKTKNGTGTLVVTVNEPDAEVQRAAVANSQAEGLRFVDLFNGHDLTGWNVIGDHANWNVDGNQGTLTATGKGVGWLLTNKDYADFVLRLEYQAEAGANSGVAILASPADKQHLEVQIGQIVGWATGGVWSDLANTKDAGFIPVAYPAQEKTGQEWNSLEIDLRSRQLKIVVNGTEVLKLDVSELASRSNAYPAWKRTRGRIGLQSQTNAVRFRNVRVAEIAPLRLESNLVDDWNRLDSYWRITPQEITGSTDSSKLDFSTFLCSSKRYRDFELACQVWLKKGNSGIQIRSEFADRSKWTLKGPQVDMGPEYWGCLYGEQTDGMMQEAPSDFERLFVKPDEFNDVSVRCVGKHVTVKINGQTSVDRDFPEIADEGFIGLQLHRGETEVVFRNVHLTEIQDSHSSFNSPAFQQWIKDVQALPAEQQVEAVSKKLMELNPGFDGKITGPWGKGAPQIERGVVVSLNFSSDRVTDISPVRAFSGLKGLGCAASGSGKSQLADLSPLKELSLTEIGFSYTQVSSLSPLQGMPLTYLGFMSTPVTDLSALQGGNLTDVHFTPKNITSGLDVLRQMKSLKFLGTSYSEKLPPDEFWKKYGN